MKGYSPRERLGLIMLILVVVALFLTERLIDSAGCERTDNKRVEAQEKGSLQGSENNYVIDSLNSDSAAPETESADGATTSRGTWMSGKDRSEAHRRSDSIRDKNKEERTYKTKEEKTHRKKSRKTTKKSKPSSPAPQRSLRDERL